jgi:hypothetical protein
MKPEHNTALYSVLSGSDSPRYLCANLQSILLSYHKPNEILIVRHCDHDRETDPFLTDFLFSQTLELAKIYEIPVIIEYVPKHRGIRYLRDFQLNWAKSDQSCVVLWCMDEDVTAHSDCFRNFTRAIDRAPNPWIVISGVKHDVSNLRGYPDYTRRIHAVNEADEDEGETEALETHFLYKPDNNEMFTYTPISIKGIDTGNIVYNVEELRSLEVDPKPLKFTTHKDHFNAPGEDTMFAIQALARGYPLLFSPYSRGHHFDKPQEERNWSVFEATREAVLRTCNALGIDERHFHDIYHK